MNEEASSGKSGFRKLFVCLLLVYLLFFLVFVEYVWIRFGLAYAIGGGLLAGIPLVIGRRFYSTWKDRRKRDFMYLAAVTLMVCVSLLYLHGAWYRSCIDLTHAEDVRWAKFERALHKDPAFEKVEVDSIMSHKFGYSIRGSVPTESDLERLQGLLLEYSIEDDIKQIQVEKSSETEM